LEEKKENIHLGAIILAAGNGARIGIPKLRLHIEGHSYIEHILGILRQEGVNPVVCVVE
jgi:CTP:molybdopterin cytidylyltransferase MocA